MLVLRPVGGLCNRLLAIASAVTLSQETGKALRIIWERNPMLNCPFNELFNPLVSDIMLEERSSNERLFERIKRRLTHFHYDKVIYMNVLAKNNIKAETINAYDSILIYGANRFYSLPSLSELFIPLPNISLIVEGQMKQLGRNPIGIHIRRTDHKRSIMISPSSLFITKIKEEIALNSDAVFFLATDDHEEELFIKSQFPNSIFTYSKVLSRNTKKGIEDALIDLLCLARCIKIYGSYYSSFSYTAAQFNNRELIVLSKDS